MKKILLVLAILAGTVFLGQPAVAAEGDDATEQVAAAPSEPKAPADEPPKAPAPEEAPPPEQQPESAPAPAVDEAEKPPVEKAEKPPVEKAEEPPVDEAEEPVADEAEEPRADETPAEEPASQERAVKQSTKKVAAAPVKIKICHATASQSNPYIENSPNQSADLNGHAGHTGPVFVAGGPAGWGDIIPPFTFNGTSFAGLNWTTAGQAIYDNGCAPVGQPPVQLTSATAVAPTTIAPTCGADGSLVLPTTTGVIYSSSPDGTGPGTYTVTASAAVGFVLTNPDYEESVTVLPQVTGAECVIGGLKPATAELPTLSDATCSADGTFTLADTDNVFYADIVIMGSHYVTAIPAPGYYLTNPLLLVFTEFTPQDELTGEQCDTVDLTICHRTNSNVKPYVSIGPAVAAFANGHDSEHEGPLWNPTLKAQQIEWGDIIPPYTYEGVDYPGQNWDAAGQLILANGCAPTDGLATEVTPLVTTTDVCDGGERPVIAEVAGVVYSFTTGDGVTGPWEITATLLNDTFEFADGAQTVFSGDAGDPSRCVTPAVTTAETCDGAQAPTPTPIEGVVYAYTVGDGLAGPWEITASAADGFFLADDVQTVFSGDAGDPSRCVTPAVTTAETCDGAQAPTPTPIEGVVYAYTVGDGLAGPWEITASAADGFFLADDVQTVFSGDAGDPTSVECVGSGGGDNDPGEGSFGGDTPSSDVAAAASDPVRENDLLPDTGGVPLWFLLLGGSMTAAGIIILMSRRPVVHAFSAGAGPAYALALPPRAVQQLPVAEAALTGLRGVVARVVAGVRRLLGGRA
ncbi:hypothetical protein [Aeromicrobium stalagmiti]|uniref:hypothetical protein n=1 Tax=Aeromicrobium stalagmiti TaxID=2738988 RepID=UPI00156882B7|nr:hypothetical protein [Aeromicrobium stalagmiti]NRQ51119.1 hypothetical protein [Aeromicrobium stalagmiti]